MADESYSSSLKKEEREFFNLDCVVDFLMMFYFAALDVSLLVKAPKMKWKDERRTCGLRATQLSLVGKQHKKRG